MAAKKDDNGAFEKHAKEDTALTPTQEETATSSSRGATMLGKIFVFIIFPTTVGVIGLYTSYLETRRRVDKKLSFDQDFMVPFLLALAMAVVIGIQTGGFSSNKVKPLVAWPKVRRVKKIVKKKKGATEEEEEEEEDAISNKKDN